VETNVGMIVVTVMESVKFAAIICVLRVEIVVIGVPQQQIVTVENAPTVTTTPASLTVVKNVGTISVHPNASVLTTSVPSPLVVVQTVTLILTVTLLGGVKHVTLLIINAHQAKEAHVHKIQTVVVMSQTQGSVRMSIVRLDRFVTMW